MGYLTRYDLTITDGDESLISELRSEYGGADYALDDDGNCYDETKWYSHEEDMRAFSKKHPKAFFKLSGEGEESGDIWEAYFKAGKMQLCKARIVLDEFDESKLC